MIGRPAHGLFLQILFTICALPPTPGICIHPCWCFCDGKQLLTPHHSSSLSFSVCPGSATSTTSPGLCFISSQWFYDIVLLVVIYCDISEFWEEVGGEHTSSAGLHKLFIGIMTWNLQFILAMPRCWKFNCFLIFSSQTMRSLCMYEWLIIISLGLIARSWMRLNIMIKRRVHTLSVALSSWWFWVSCLVSLSLSSSFISWG